jgi:hypothetical protein
VPPTPRIIEIHATRGGVRWQNWPDESLEFQATINWVKSPANREVSASGQAWGGCAHAVISEQGQLATIWDKMDRYPTYAAGYGDIGWPPGWALDWIGIAYELCQPLGDMPFTDRCLERAAVEVARDCMLFEIEPVRIDYLAQTEDMWTVSGLVGHEDTANGHKVHNSDPGTLFPWENFVAEVRRIIREEEGQMGTPAEWKAYTLGLLAELKFLHELEAALLPIQQRKDRLQASWRRGPDCEPLDHDAYRKGLGADCDKAIAALQALKARAM